MPEPEVIAPVLVMLPVTVMLVLLVLKVAVPPLVSQFPPTVIVPGVIGLAEVMDIPAVLAGETGVLEKIHAALVAGSALDGHGPSLLGQALQAYASTGIRSNCATLVCRSSSVIEPSASTVARVTD